MTNHPRRRKIFLSSVFNINYIVQKYSFITSMVGTLGQFVSLTGIVRGLQKLR